MLINDVTLLDYTGFIDFVMSEIANEFEHGNIIFLYVYVHK